MIAAARTKRGAFSFGGPTVLILAPPTSPVVSGRPSGFKFELSCAWAMVAMTASPIVVAGMRVRNLAGHPGFPNKPAGALDDQWIFGCEGVSAQCGIDAIFLSDAAARQASPGLRLCNHRESDTRSVGMERHCLPIRWLATEPGTG